MIALFSRNLSSKVTLRNSTRIYVARTRLRDAWHGRGLLMQSHFIGISFLRCKRKVLQIYFFKTTFWWKKAFMYWYRVASFFFLLWHFIAWHLMWRGAGGAGGGVREAGEEGTGSGRKRGKLRNIAQYFAIWKKCKEAGANKYRAGTGIKGYGKRVA